MTEAKSSAVLWCGPRAGHPVRLDLIEVSVERGKDGTLVVHIDTSGEANTEDDDGPLLRVYMNDDGEPLYANPPYTPTPQDTDD